MFCNPSITLVLRHVLTGFGILLVNKGLTDRPAVDEVASQAAELVSGVICTFGAVVWSAVDKAKNGIFGLTGDAKSHSEISARVNKVKANG